MIGSKMDLGSRITHDLGENHAFPSNRQSGIVGYVDGMGIPHTIFTTGRWTVNKPDEVIRIYQGCEYFEGMLVSLHGSTKEAHNAFVESVEGFTAERSVEEAGRLRE